MNTKDTAMLNDQDKGTALLAWYELAIRDYPEGLVTQAQAAKMLNISRTAVSRLVSRDIVNRMPWLVETALKL